MTTLLPADVVAALARPGARARVGSFGRYLEYRRRVSSTNDVALELARSGAPDGTTVLASDQTAGRGRRGRTWFSPADAGLYVSVVIRQQALPAVTLLMGVAAAEAIRSATGVAVELEWPNDLVVRDGRPVAGGRAKVGGILCEATGVPETPTTIVAGVGVNLAAVPYPGDIASRTSSLEAALGGPVDRGVILVELLAGVAAWRTRCASGDLTAMLERWQTLSPSSRGAHVRWRGPEGVHHGVTAGVDTCGALLVQAGTRVERIIGGAVEWGVS